MSTSVIGQEVFNNTTTANAASLVAASNGPVYLCGLTGYNANTSTQFIQIHDAASLPADTAVPKIVFEVQASSKFALDYGSSPRKFTTGIVICNSSTQATKTIGSANCWFDVQMKKAGL